MVIATVSLKGGVSKTTTAMFLAACAAEDGRETIVLDADPEMSAIAWAQQAVDLPFRVVRADPDALTKQARTLSHAGATVIIDTPPNARDVLMAAALAADLALVPVAPTHIDANRLMRTLRVLVDVAESKPQLLIRVMFTKVARGTRLAAVIAQALEAYPTLPVNVRDLERYKAAGGKKPSYLTEYREVWHAIKEIVETPVADVSSTEEGEAA